MDGEAALDPTPLIVRAHLGPGSLVETAPRVRGARKGDSIFRRRIYVAEKSMRAGRMNAEKVFSSQDPFVAGS